MYIIYIYIKKNFIFGTHTCKENFYPTTKNLEIPLQLLTRLQWKTLDQQPSCYCKSLTQNHCINLLLLSKPTHMQKNKHHSSIQCWHIADLILIITCGWSRYA